MTAGLEQLVLKWAEGKVAKMSEKHAKAAVAECAHAGGAVFSYTVVVVNRIPLTLWMTAFRLSVMPVL